MVTGLVETLGMLRRDVSDPPALRELGGDAFPGGRAAGAVQRVCRHGRGIGHGRVRTDLRRFAEELGDKR